MRLTKEWAVAEGQYNFRRFAIFDNSKEPDIGPAFSNERIPHNSCSRDWNPGDLFALGYFRNPGGEQPRSLWRPYAQLLTRLPEISNNVGSVKPILGHTYPFT